MYIYNKWAQILHKGLFYTPVVEDTLHRCPVARYIKAMELDDVTSKTETGGPEVRFSVLGFGSDRMVKW